MTLSRRLVIDFNGMLVGWINMGLWIDVQRDFDDCWCGVDDGR